MKKISVLFWLSLVALFFLLSCREKVAMLPKPRAYPKVNFPVKQYEKASLPDCAFQFEKPSYARVVKDEFFFEDKTPDPCWFDLVFPEYNGKLHCSYYPIRGRVAFDSLVTDAFALVSKHRIKANFRDEFIIQKENNVSGILFDLGGPVASPMQFFLTDSTQHFFRGALYFENKVNPDSMNIIHEFIKEDINKMIESFSWD